MRPHPRNLTCRLDVIRGSPRAVWSGVDSITADQWPMLAPSRWLCVRMCIWAEMWLGLIDSSGRGGVAGPRTGCDADLRPVRASVPARLRTGISSCQDTGCQRQSPASLSQDSRTSATVHSCNESTPRRAMLNSWLPLDAHWTRVRYNDE